MYNFKLKINHKIWNVHILDNNSFDETLSKISSEEGVPFDNSLYTLGLTSGYRNEIFIRHITSKEEQRSVFIHEYTHAWLYSHGFCANSYDEEAIANLLPSILPDLTNALSVYNKEVFNDDNNTNTN